MPDNCSSVSYTHLDVYKRQLLESRYAVCRRDRTIHARLRDYLYELKHREDLLTSVVPIGDGVTVSVKILPEKKGTSEENHEET